MMLKLNRVFAVLSLLMLSLGALVMPTAAQETRTVTLTESQINEAYRLQNPRRVRVSNRTVDLQSGQVVVNADYTFRNATYNVTTTLVPAIQDSTVVWTVTSVVTDPATQVPDELLAQFNANIQTSWRNYLKAQFPTTAESITVTDTEIIVTGTGDPAGERPRWRLW